MSFQEGMLQVWEVRAFWDNFVISRSQDLMHRAITSENYRGVCLETSFRENVGKVLVVWENSLFPIGHRCLKSALTNGIIGTLKNDLNHHSAKSCSLRASSPFEGVARSHARGRSLARSEAARFACRTTTRACSPTAKAGARALWSSVLASLVTNLNWRYYRHANLVFVVRRPVIYIKLNCWSWQRGNLAFLLANVIPLFYWRS